MAARITLKQGTPGWHLRQAAEAAGRTAAQIAEHVGTDPATVRRWWRWGTDPEGRELGGQRLLDYAEFCGVTAEEALGRAERPSPRSVQMALVRMARGLMAGASTEEVMEAMTGEPPTSEEVQRLSVPMATMRRYFAALAALTDEELLREIERLEQGASGLRGGAKNSHAAATIH